MIKTPLAIALKRTILYTYYRRGQ